jgi:TetR/AcrR family transcriptional regulator, cholesterol catabolism regulator
MINVRTQQRVATQRNILMTARKLFLEASFDSVGVREIAAEAGVATGTVIAAFGSKVDLLHAIVIEDMNEQLVLMKEAAMTAENAFDRICNLCVACISFQTNRVAIVRASMADAWTRSDEAENKIRKATKPMHRVVVDELKRGVARGEIRSDMDVRLGALLILETLINTYRIPLYEDTPTADMGQVLRERLNIILRGFASVAEVQNFNRLVEPVA